MEKEYLLETSKRIIFLAEAVAEYARVAWSTLAHRPRQFTFQAAPLQLDGTPAVLHMRFSSTYEIHANYVVTHTVVNPWQDNVGVLCHFLNHSSPQGVVQRLQLVKGFEGHNFVDKILAATVAGLQGLFVYVQEECQRCSKEYASEDATRRWGEFEKKFLSRVNSQILVDVFEAALRDIVHLECDLRMTPVLSGPNRQIQPDGIVHYMKYTADRALNKIAACNEATRQRKLFIE